MNNSKLCKRHKSTLAQTHTRRAGCTRWICRDGCVWFHSNNGVWFQLSNKLREEIKRGYQIRVSESGKKILSVHGLTPQKAIDEKIRELQGKDK